MTSSSQHAVTPRSRRGVRSWSIAVVTAGAVLLPAASALADHMPGMNGTMCPHASGEGPDALAAPGPNEPAAPERAPSETPLAPTGQSGPATAAPVPASKPAAQQVTRPATQVSKPATQVQTRVTTTAQSAPASTRTQGTVRAVATTPVAASKRAAAAQPRAKRAVPRARPERSFERRFNGLEPRAARPSPATPEAVVAAPAVRGEAAESAPSVPLLLLLGLLTVGGLAAAVLVGRRRGGAGGVVTGAPPERPAAPAYADAAVEAELHEIIAEARARRLLVPGESDEPAERGESVGTR